MMKRELTLTDIAGYLPHGLKALQHNIKHSDTVFEMHYHPIKADQRVVCGISDIFKLSEISPVLRPMSDLCEEITEQGYNEGKPFVPIVTMAKVAYNGVGDWGHPIYSGEVYQCSCNGIFYGFEPADGSFIVCDQTGFPVFSPKQRDLFDLLHRLHFDYRGLIDAGLAVSVHDLKQNPYE